MNRFASLGPIGRAAPFIGLALCLCLLAYNMPSQTKPSHKAENETRSVVNDLYALVHKPSETKGLVAGERVIELPEDGHVWSLILVTDQSPLSQHLISEMNKTPRLRQLMAQTKVYNLKANDPWVVKNRAGYPTPLICLQRPTDPLGSNDWERVYESWGSGIPGKGDKLADDITEMIYVSVERRPCPQPQPQPSPTPFTPQPVAPVEPLAPMIPEEEPAEEEPGGAPFWWYLAAAASGLGGAYFAAKRTY